MLGIFVASVLSQDTFPPRLLWPISSMVISVALFTLCANYFMERDERRRFLRTLRERSLVRDLTQAHARLKDISRIDTLTGLHNQKHIQQHLNLVWERAWRDRSALSLLLIDIDGFQRLNDEHGHEVGDAALRHLSSIVYECIRETDAFGRLDGEEFGLLFPATSGAEAMVAAERIRATVAARSLEAGAGFTISIGVTGGHAFSDPWAAAERALSLAKAAGTNRVVLAETETQAETEPYEDQPEGDLVVESDLDRTLHAA